MCMHKFSVRDLTVVLQMKQEVDFPARRTLSSRIFLACSSPSVEGMLFQAKDDVRIQQVHSLHLPQKMCCPVQRLRAASKKSDRFLGC